MPDDMSPRGGSLMTKKSTHHREVIAMPDKIRILLLFKLLSLL